MSRENAAIAAIQVALSMFQSAPGSMSRENVEIDSPTCPGLNVSIRSRLDEPGEPAMKPGSCAGTCSFNPLPAR